MTPLVQPAAHGSEQAASLARNFHTFRATATPAQQLDWMLPALRRRVKLVPSKRGAVEVGHTSRIGRISVCCSAVIRCHVAATNAHTKEATKAPLSLPTKGSAGDV